jgi:hypothetical protein
MLREKPNWQSQEGESTDAEHRGGAIRISDEAAVMAVERRNRIVQQNELVNHYGRNQCVERNRLRFPSTTFWMLGTQ